MSTTGTALVSDAGVSLWLDDLSRDRLTNGSLRNLVATHRVVGVTTNPSIFSQAITGNTAYDADIAGCRARGLSVEDTITELTTTDVRNACDEFHEVYTRSHRRDGYVSIEVEPHLARDSEGTNARAKELWKLVDRENVMIKIPATEEGLASITETIASGINVNVTLIFSLRRYREVINAYQTGLELARDRGHDLGRIHSVASFFVSRVDTAVDPLIESGDAVDHAHVGTFALANAAAAYEIYEQSLTTVRAQHLTELGANHQRPLWASTGVKDARFPAAMYVTELVAPNTVNTVPEATLHAAHALTSVEPDAIRRHQKTAAKTLHQLRALGTTYDELTHQLEQEGLIKFEDSWNELVTGVRERLKA